MQHRNPILGYSKAPWGLSVLLDTREVAARFGTKRLERMREEAAPYLQSGALRDAGGRLAVPPERFLISDAVIEALFET